MKKKLLDPNRFINDDDSLPGSPSGTPNAKKPLSLFKYTPKVFTPSISTPSLFKPKSDLPTFGIASSLLNIFKYLFILSLQNLKSHQEKVLKNRQKARLPQQLFLASHPKPQVPIRIQ